MKYGELVTIICPCYNAERFIDIFFKLIINQDYRPLELLIVDDGSTDRTSELIKRNKKILESTEKDICVKHFYQKHSGQASAINLCLKNFSGKYLTFFDVDDLVHYNNVSAKVLELVDKNVDYVISNGVYVDDKTRKVISRYGRFETDLSPKKHFFDLLQSKNVVYGPGSILIKADSFKNCIPHLKIVETKEGQNYQIMLPITYCLKYSIIYDNLCNFLKRADSHSNKKRNAKEFLKRNDEFLMVSLATIEAIPNMSQRDYKDAVSILIRKYNEFNLFYCYRHFKLFRAMRYLNKLKESKTSNPNYNFFIFWYNYFKRRFKK